LLYFAPEVKKKKNETAAAVRMKERTVKCSQ
jgi:hypothetical protein